MIVNINTTSASDFLKSHWAAIASAGLIVYHYFSPSLTNYLANHPHISFWTFIVAVVIAFYSQSPILPTHARKAPALKPEPQAKDKVPEEPRSEGFTIPAPYGYIDPNALRSDDKYTNMKSE